jgi:hypothetical protein
VYNSLSSRAKSALSANQFTALLQRISVLLYRFDFNAD